MFEKMQGQKSNKCTTVDKEHSGRCLSILPRDSMRIGDCPSDASDSREAGKPSDVAASH